MTAPTPDIIEVAAIELVDDTWFGVRPEITGPAGFLAACCHARPEPTRHRFRTLRRAQVVLAAHLAGAHNVDVDPARLWYRPAGLCPACHGAGAPPTAEVELSPCGEAPAACTTCGGPGWIPGEPCPARVSVS